MKTIVKTYEAITDVDEQLKEFQAFCENNYRPESIAVCRKCWISQEGGCPEKQLFCFATWLQSPHIAD